MLQPQSESRGYRCNLQQTDKYMDSSRSAAVWGDPLPPITEDFEPHSEVFFKFCVAFCHCASVATASNSQKDAQWWITQQTRPVLLFSLLQRQLWAAWNKLSNLLPLPWLSVQWIETGLPEMAFLKQETKTWFTLQNVCVCIHRERDWNGFWLQGVKMMRWDLNWWQLILLSPSVNLMCSQHTYSLNYLLSAMCVLGIANIKGQLKCLSPFQSSLQWKILMDTKKKKKKMGHFAWKDEKPGLHRRLN